jgi:hypothetical protein
MIPNLINCLIDKSKDVRILAEHVILIGVRVNGMEVFKFFINDLKPAFRNQVQEFFDRMEKERMENSGGEKYGVGQVRGKDE